MTQSHATFRSAGCLLPAACLAVVLWAFPAHATQTHGDPEGLVVHQIAHLFFSVAMGFLIFWLRDHNLTAKSGWRFLQYAAILLIVWNLDAFLVHTLEETSGLLEIQQAENWRIQITARNGSRALEMVYYLAKLDHLWCVPALIFLYIGLRRLAHEGE